MHKTRFSQRGFSLIEVMVVIVIISLLAGVAAVNVNSRLQQAKVSAAKTQIKDFETALKLYALDNDDQYPSKLEDLLKKQKNSKEPYIPGGEEKLKDPWGEKFLYKVRDGVYEIICRGADKKAGGTGYDEDIKVTNAEKSSGD